MTNTITSRPRRDRDTKKLSQDSLNEWHHLET